MASLVNSAVLALPPPLWRQLAHCPSVVSMSTVLVHDFILEYISLATVAEVRHCPEPYRVDRQNTSQHQKGAVDRRVVPV